MRKNDVQKATEQLKMFNNDSAPEPPHKITMPIVVRKAKESQPTKAAKRRVPKCEKDMRVRVLDGC